MGVGPGCAKVERQEKKVAFSEALNRLENDIQSLENFASRVCGCDGAPSIEKTETDTTLSAFLSHGPEAVDALRGRIVTAQGELEKALF